MQTKEEVPRACAARCVWRGRGSEACRWTHRPASVSSGESAASSTVEPEVGVIPAVELMSRFCTTSGEASAYSPAAAPPRMSRATASAG